MFIAGQGRGIPALKNIQFIKHFNKKFCFAPPRAEHSLRRGTRCEAKLLFGRFAGTYSYEAQTRKYLSVVEKETEMWKIGLYLTVLGAIALSLSPHKVMAYDFGDNRSVTLVTKAWQALGANDLEAVLAYTNRCIELYSGEAQKMQSSLTTYPTGSNAEIFSYWALNDVATALFIQGDAYRKAGRKEEAQKAFQTLMDHYSYGQCWDPKGWFWKPAEGAKERLSLMESGMDMDLSDSSSSALTSKAWEALNNKDLDSVLAYTDKCIELYGDKAREMQDSLTMYAWESKEKVFSYWALNDVGTCLYIKGKALAEAGRTKEAREAYQRLIEDFKFAQCWDPGGWFWKPAEAAGKELNELN